MITNWGHVFRKIYGIQHTVRRDFVICQNLSTNTRFCSGSKMKDIPESNVSYDELMKTANYLLARIPQKPAIAIICGFGMNTLPDSLFNKIEIPYDEVPNFPVGTVEGNTGKFVFGLWGKAFICCMKGRFYPYEGYPIWKCALPIRVLKLLGVQYLITSSSAGGINPAYNEGDVMLIKDHIDLMGIVGKHPLTGPNDPNFGPRFFSMDKTYDKDLIEKAKYIWHEESFQGRIFDGVYMCVNGPNFETVAEVRMLKLLGVDAVGVSTTYEVVTAKHCGMTVFAFCLISDKCAFDYNEFVAPTYEDILDLERLREETIKRFARKMIDELAYRLEKNTKK